MSLDPRSWSRRRAGTVTVLVVLALLVASVVLALTSPPAQLRAYGDGPGDASAFRRVVQEDGYATASAFASPHVLQGIDDPAHHLLVVLGAEREYMASEADSIEEFVRRGGRLVVADDFGHGNGVAERFGVTFERVQLVDATYHRNASFVRVNATLQGSSYDLVTNVPGVLTVAPGSEATVLARTTADAYVDTDGDGVEDEGDAKGPFLVAVQVEAGDGTVVLLSDPGLFTDAVLDEGDNEAFARDLVLNLLPGGGTVVFDESRHRAPLLLGPAQVAGGAVVVATQDRVVFPVVLVALLVAALLALVLVDPPEDLGSHVQELAAVHDRPLEEGQLGSRLRALAVRRVLTAHGAVDAGDRLEQARLLVRDDRLAELLGSEEPRVAVDDAPALLERIRTYEDAAGTRREVTT